jgi:hypothetical protein
LLRSSVCPWSNRPTKHKPAYSAAEATVVVHVTVVIATITGIVTIAAATAAARATMLARRTRDVPDMA